MMRAPARDLPAAAPIGLRYLLSRVWPSPLASGCPAWLGIRSSAASRPLLYAPMASLTATGITLTL